MTPSRTRSKTRSPKFPRSGSFNGQPEEIAQKTNQTAKPISRFPAAYAAHRNPIQPTPSPHQKKQTPRSDSFNGQPEEIAQKTNQTEKPISRFPAAYAAHRNPTQPIPSPHQKNQTPRSGISFNGQPEEIAQKTNQTEKPISRFPAAYAAHRNPTPTDPTQIPSTHQRQHSQTPVGICQTARRRTDGNLLDSRASGARGRNRMDRQRVRRVLRRLTESSTRTEPPKNTAIRSTPNHPTKTIYC